MTPMGTEIVGRGGEEKEVRSCFRHQEQVRNGGEEFLGASPSPRLTHWDRRRLVDDGDVAVDEDHLHAGHAHRDLVPAGGGGAGRGGAGRVGGASGGK